MTIDQSSPPGLRARLSGYWWTARLACAKFNALSHHALRWLAMLLVLAYFIFCGLFLTLRYAVLPNIDNYKGDIERLTSELVGRPVTIARVYASWSGLQPNLSLNDVVLLDKDGRQALSLPSIYATFSWWSVVAGEVRLALLEINRPDLEIRRTADGSMYVGGIFVDTNKSAGNRGANWLLAQTEIVVHEGRVRWNDQQRRTPELILGDLNFRLRNQARHHQFGLQAAPPVALAAPIDLRAEFVHPHFSRNISDPLHWKGVLFAHLPNADLAAWRAYADYPIELMQGAGSVRAWLHFNRARIADFTADLTLSDVSARLREDLQPLDLARVNGRIFAREEFDPAAPVATPGMPPLGARAHTFSISDFSLTTKSGLRLPPTTISEAYVPGKNGKPDRTTVYAQQIDLRTMANFAERLPLTPAQLQMLADFAPRGELRNFSAAWTGTYPEIAAYAVKGQFVGLSLKAQPGREARAKSATAPAQAAVPAIPGFENLSGRLDASDRGGSFSLDATRLQLTLPGYFTEPAMPIDLLKMQAGWTFRGKDQLLFKVDSMHLVQDGMVAALSGTHLMPLTKQAGKPLGEIDMSGQVSGVDLKKIGRYLPPQTPEHLRNWLLGALQGGRADAVAIRLKGDLAQMPFRREKTGDKAADGIFRIAGKIEDGRLNFDPGFFGKDGKSPLWPEIEQINGSFAFDNTRMEIRGDSAKTHGVALSEVKVVIADLASNDGMLEVDGNAAGLLQDHIDYVNDSPVAGWIDDFTAESKGSGTARLALKLRLPLKRMLESKVDGTLQFNNNDLSLQEAIPALSALKGKLEFNEKGINLNGVGANLLGGPALASGGSQADGSIRIKVDGSISAAGLRKLYPAPAIQGLTRRIAGSTRYGSTIAVKNHQLELLVESGLQGLALDFPAPLHKAANATLPLKVQLGALPSSDPLLLRDQIRISLGTTIAAHYLRQKTVEKQARWRVLRGGIGVNAPPPLPDSGLAANVELQSLNVDEWRRVSSEIAAAGNTDSAKSAAAPAPPDAAQDIGQYVEPESMAARAKTLFVMGKRLDNVVVGASHQKQTWQANIDSAQASGYVTWDSTAGTMGKVTARLATLTIPQSDASDVGNLLEGAPTQIPSVNIVAENFELFNKRLGRLELVANNLVAPTLKPQGMREWRINRLTLANEDASMSAAGRWVTRDGQSKTELTYALDVADAGKLLRRFGYHDILRGGKGRLDGDINWVGLPFALDIPSLSGQIHLDMAAGQFLKVEPGAAKLLGVLSLQSLPRRLTLDFRDIFSEGFSFDGISATATIERGVARTDNFKMRSMTAAVLMDGSADIAKESQNLHVAVIPEINAGAASVVYALAVNPVIGLGTFLAQLFLREPLARAFTYQYQISGPWKDPVVTKINYKARASAGVSNR